MLGLLPILSLVANIVTAILTNRGVIGANTDTLITSLMSAVTPLVTSLSAGASKVQDTLAVLGALSGVIAVLKTTTGLPAGTLAQIDAFDKDVQAGLIAYVQSGKGVDLSVLTPLAPVV